MSARAPIDPTARPDEPGLASEMVRCLEHIAALREADDLDAGERRLRCEQYLECAAGGECPEVAFDPVARRLRAIAARLRAAPDGAVHLLRWVTQVRLAAA